MKWLVVRGWGLVESAFGVDVGLDGRSTLSWPTSRKGLILLLDCVMIHLSKGLSSCLLLVLLAIVTM